MMCSSTRYLVIAGLTGMSVATLTGSDTAGWLAAAVAALVVYLAGRRFGTRCSGGACARADVSHDVRQVPCADSAGPQHL